MREWITYCPQPKATPMMGCTPEPLETFERATLNIGKKCQFFFPSLMLASAPVDQAQPVFVPDQLTPAVVGMKMGTLPIVKIFCAIPAPMFVVTVNGFVEVGNTSTAVKA